MQVLQPIGLSPPVRVEALSALTELVPLWLSENSLDLKRVVRPQGGGQFSINIEAYHGVQTWISFRKKLEGRESLQRIESTIREHQPELLGYIRSPSHSWLIQDALGLVICWCQAAAQYVKNGASVDASISRVLRELDAMLSSRRAIHELITPLTGLNLPEDLDSLSLGDRVVLRKLTPEELSDLGSNDVSSTNHHDILSLSVSTALVVTHDVELSLTTQYPETPPDVMFQQKLQEQLDSVLCSLHLLKEGRVGVVASFTTLKPSVLPNMGGYSTSPLVRHPFASMQLSREDIEPLIAVYGKLATNHRDEVRIGAARLLDAEHRLSPVDALLDAVIGLEVLLNPMDYAELSFRVALNYSYLTGESERRQRYEHVRDIQKTRNKVVHGGLNLRSKDAPIIHVHAVLAKACLRDALRRFLSEPTFEGNSKLDVDFWLDRLIPPNG